MQAAWQLARNALSGRPGRTALLVGATGLAAALVAAVACSIASGQQAARAGFARFLGNADARIVHPAAGRFDEDVLDLVRTWPEVAAATGRLGGSLTLVRADGGRDPETDQLYRITPQVTGIDVDLIERFRRIDLVDGRMPADPSEILVDPRTQEALAVEPGDVLRVQRFGPPIELTVSGVYDRRNLGALQRPRIYVDRTMVAEAANLSRQLTSIYIILEPGTDVDAFCATYADAVPEIVSLEPAEMVRTGFDRRVRYGQIALVVLTLMAFISAGFIVVTGLTTGVTERQRELALLRAIGAGRRQLFLSQLMVGLWMGALGALFGAPLGVGLAWGLVTVYREFVPEGLALHWPGIAASVGGSILAGLIGAVWPAATAARTSPLDAMSVRARAASRGGLIACSLAGLAAMSVHHLVRAVTDDSEALYFGYAFLGLPLLFIGCFLLAVPALLGVSVVLGPPLARALRLPTDLLRGAVRSTPYRHGFTGGALMVGMALLVASWAGGLAVQRGFIERIRFADGFAFRPSGLTEEQISAISSLPFVEETCEVGQIQVRIVGEQVFGIEGISPRNVVLVGFDSDQFLRINRIEWLAGEPDVALPQLRGGNGLLVAEQFLTAKGYDLGDRITLGVGRIEQEFEIVGVITAAGLDIAAQMFGIQSAYSELAVSCVFLDSAVVADVFENSDVHLVQVMLSDEVTDAEAEAAVAEAAPGVLFKSGREIIASVRDIAAATLAIQTTVAFGALVLASLAVANVIAADVSARRFEFGVMRSIGTERQTIRRLVAAETILVATAGGLAGTLLGVQMAMSDIALMRALGGLTVRLQLPYLPAAVGWVVLVVLAVLASRPAARRLLKKSPAELVA